MSEAVLANPQQCEIRVNGETRSVTSHNLVELIAELGLAGKKLAIERNQAIVPRAHYAETAIQDGDSIEIVHFVGGG